MLYGPCWEGDRAGQHFCNNRHRTWIRVDMQISPLCDKYAKDEKRVHCSQDRSFAGW
jgi:hypothetical protein